MAKVKETVNHPAHYNREGAMECIDEMVLVFGVEEAAIFCKLNAYKYRYRAGSKGDPTEDMKKSDWYMRKYKDLIEKNEIYNYIINDIDCVSECLEEGHYEKNNKNN